MMDIIQRLQIADISYHPLNLDAIKEIESLRAELKTKQEYEVQLECAVTNLRAELEVADEGRNAKRQKVGTK